MTKFCTYCSECGAENKCEKHKGTDEECRPPDLRQEYCEVCRL